MNAFVPAGRTVAKIAVPIAPKTWRYRSTSTRDPLTVTRMQTMIHELRTFRASAWEPEGAWDLLGRLAHQKGPAHPDAWTLMDLHAFYQLHRGDIAAMRLALAAVATAKERERTDPLLDTLFEPFLEHLQQVRKRTEDTANHYSNYLETLADAGITRLSHLTAPDLGDWLDGLAEPDDKGVVLATGTRRKYAAGVSMFCTYLVRKRLLKANPMRDVEKPDAGKRRMQWIPEPQMIALANAQVSPFRELSAFIHGTGLDVSVACDRIEAGAIDLTSWSFTSVRPKTDHQHTVVVAEWARPFVRELLRGKLPRALLGEGVTRWALSDSHRAACKALKIPNYWLRDARHSWSVRFDDLGGSPADGAEQLGHADGGVLYQSLYSRRARSVKDRQAIETKAERGAEPPTPTAQRDTA